MCEDVTLVCETPAVTTLRLFRLSTLRARGADPTI
jgi:hypothetical protein